MPGRTAPALPVEARLGGREPKLDSPDAAHRLQALRHAFKRLAGVVQIDADPLQLADKPEPGLLHPMINERNHRHAMSSRESNLLLDVRGVDAVRGDQEDDGVARRHDSFDFLQN